MNFPTGQQPAQLELAMLILKPDLFIGAAPGHGAVIRVPIALPMVVRSGVVVGVLYATQVHAGPCDQGRHSILKIFGVN